MGPLVAVVKASDFELKADLRMEKRIPFQQAHGEEG